MATSTSSGAIYGVGVYGVDRYGSSNIAVVPDGVQGTLHPEPGFSIRADSLHVIVDVNELAMVASIGGDGVTGDAVVDVTGVEATVYAGTITQKTVNRVPVTGIAATGEVGTLSITGDSNFVLNVSVSGSGAIGTPVVRASAPVSVTGNSASGSVGTAVILENEVQVLAGVSATGRTGTVTVTTTAFNYAAVASQYDAARAVLVLRRTTSKDRTVRVPAAA